MNTLIPLELRELKRFLKCLKPGTVLCPGLGDPHPYRGGASSLSFAPKITTTVAELLSDIEKAQTVYLKYHNGVESDYLYEDITPVYVASVGHVGNALTLEALIRSVEGWVKIGEGFDRNH